VGAGDAPSPAKARFQLCQLPDGATTIDATVDVGPNLQEMYVLASPSTYLLVTSRPVQQAGGIIHQPLSNGGAGNPLINGHVHVFDRSTGEKIASTRIDRHGLLLAQPPGLPALVFATTVYSTQQNNNVRRGARATETTLLFLDKRTGRILHEESPPMTPSPFSLTGEWEQKEMLFRGAGSSVRLTFTGEPFRPAAKAGPAENSDANGDAAKGKSDAKQSDSTASPDGKKPSG
jgi:hypothetical protein